MKRLLVTVLLVALLPAFATADSATTITVSADSGNLATSFRFEASPSLLGPERLADAEFASRPLRWTVEPPVPAVEAGSGLRLRIAGETVVVRQLIELEPGTYVAEAQARLVIGDLEELVLRIDGTSIPLGADGAVHGFSVAAPSTLEVALVARVPPGGVAEVQLDSVSVRSSPAYAWRIGQATAGISSVVEHRFEAPGDHRVDLFLDGVLQASRVVSVANAAPVVVVSQTPTPTGAILDATTTRDPDARSLLRNGDFARGRAFWQLDTPEVGRVGRAYVMEGSYVVSLPHEHPGGSVWSFQGLANPHESLHFSVDVRDNGRHDGYAIVLREQGPDGDHDIVVRAEPKSTWTTLSASWTPRANSTALYVQLRFLAPPDSGAEVAFRDVRLEPAYTWRWEVDGRRVPGEAPVHVVRSIPREGMDVTLKVTDAFGASATAVMPLEARSEFDGRVLGPAIVRAGEDVRLDAGDVKRIGVDLVANGEFDATLDGWRFDANEIGGHATAIVENRVLRMDYHAEREGSVFVTQLVPIRHGERYSFSVLHRDSGAGRYAFILRELGFDAATANTPHPWNDTNSAAPSSTEWTSTFIPWTPAFKDSTHVLVHIRIHVEAGERGAVWFDNASVQPRRTFEWALDDEVVARGPRPVLKAPPTGLHDLVLTVRSSGFEGRLNVPFQVVEPARIAIGLDGGVHAEWEKVSPRLIREVRVAKDGNAHTPPILPARWSDPHTERGSFDYILEIADIRGHVVELSRATLEPGQFARLRAIEPSEPDRGGTVLIRAHLPDESSYPVLLIGKSRIPLLPDDDGAYSAKVPIPLWARELRVEVEAKDAEGNAYVNTLATIPVNGFRGSGNPIAWFLVGAVLTGLLFAEPMVEGVRRWRRGG